MDTKRDNPEMRLHMAIDDVRETLAEWGVPTREVVAA